jgi:hypothetical protein
MTSPSDCLTLGRPRMRPSRRTRQKLGYQYNRARPSTWLRPRRLPRLGPAGRRGRNNDFERSAIWLSRQFQTHGFVNDPEVTRIQRDQAWAEFEQTGFCELVDPRHATLSLPRCRTSGMDGDRRRRQWQRLNGPAKPFRRPVSRAPPSGSGGVPEKGVTLQQTARKLLPGPKNALLQPRGLPLDPCGRAHGSTAIGR